MSTTPNTRRQKTAVPPHGALVIGGSAGGIDALKDLLAQLPPDFPLPVLVVLHMAATASAETLLKIVRKASAMPCKVARQHEAIRPGQVYLPQPDQHLMIAGGRILLTKGARENRSRPAIDPLFRTAAVEYGNGAIGVVLSGYLDDGTAGLQVIHRCGGATVAQLPDDALFGDMPQNAINNAHVDHAVAVGEMGPLLQRLAGRKRGRRKPVPADVATEATIAERVLSDLASVDKLGVQVPFNCPGCGGVLWQVGRGKQLRFRCHTGHAYTAVVLLAEQAGKMEETLWIALRMFEENRNLLVKMSGEGHAHPSYAERLEQSQIHIERLRTMLHSATALPDPASVRRRKHAA